MPPITSLEAAELLITLRVFDGVVVPIPTLPPFAVLIEKIGVPVVEVAIENALMRLFGIVEVEAAL